MTATRNGWIFAAVAMLACAAPLTAQQTAFKGGIAISRLAQNGSGLDPWDDDLVATSVGGHVRFRFGPIAIQPEINVVTRGGRQSATLLEDEQLRLEYMEVPVLLVVPVRIGQLEPYAFGGGMVALETRCRFVQKDAGLKSSFGCETTDPNSDVFDRNTADYGLVAGGGASYPIGSGRIFIEARYTWGMRNMVDDAAFADLRNRTAVFGIGYSVNLEAMRGQ
jgi:hypothetical protein